VLLIRDVAAVLMSMGHNELKNIARGYVFVNVKSVRTIVCFTVTTELCTHFSLQAAYVLLEPSFPFKIGEHANSANQHNGNDIPKPVTTVDQRHIDGIHPKNCR